MRVSVRRRAERLSGFNAEAKTDGSHVFSFADMEVASHLAHRRQFRLCRVFNEDTVQPGGGFDMHGHAEYEIFSIVLSGSLVHEDSLGERSIVRAGGVQHTSAGTGMRHSEKNASDDEGCLLLQVWLEPRVPGVAPAYALRHFAWLDEGSAPRTLLLSPDGGDDGGALRLNAECYVWGCRVRRDAVELASPWPRAAGFLVAFTTLAADASDVLDLSADGGASEPLRSGDCAFVESATKVVLRGGSRHALSVVVLAFGEAQWKELSIQDKWASFCACQGVSQRRLAASIGS